MMTTDGSVVMPDTLLTIAKAADVMRVCRRTIYNWIRDGKVRYVRTPGGMIRIVASSLWREETTVSPRQGFQQDAPSPAA